MAKVVFVVPRRPDHGRHDQIWQYVQRYLRANHPFWDIFEGTDDGKVFSKGKATALQIGDVNLKTRRIRVRRSVTYVRKTGLVEGPTKKPHRADGAGAQVPGSAA